MNEIPEDPQEPEGHTCDESATPALPGSPEIVQADTGRAAKWTFKKVARYTAVAVLGVAAVGFLAWANSSTATEDGSADDEFDHDDDEEDDDYEYDASLDVYDASLIYHSKGMDEDYMFGYTHAELKRAFDRG